MEKIYIQKTSFGAFDVTMNYNKDTTRLSVLVVAFLLVGSAFAFLPAFASTGAAVTKAASSSPGTNGSPPSVAGAPNVIYGATSTPFAVQVINPASNGYAIVSISVLAPSGWTFSGTPTCGSALSTVGAVSSSGVQCTIPSGGSGLPPGLAATLQLGDLTGPSSTSTSTPTQGTFSTIVVDASSAQSYAGSSFSEWTIAIGTTVSVSISATSFTAGGSALTVTSTINNGQVGVPITWNFSSTSYPTSGYTAYLSPSSALSTSTGATSSFTPSNYEGDTTSIDAFIGNGLYASGGSPLEAISAAVTTTHGTASEVSFKFTTSGATYKEDYLTTPVTASGTLYAESAATGEITMALADAYTNSVPLSSSVTALSISASGGEFYNAGSGTLSSTLSCGTSSGDFVITTAYCQSGTSGVISFPIASGDITAGVGPVYYVQSSIYGAVGSLSGVITVSGSSYSGTSGNIVTSTLVGTLAAPSILPTNGQVQAGSSVTLYNTIEPITNYYQEGVPITVNLCADCAGTSAGYNSVFSTGSQSITLYTNSSGMVQTSLNVNVTIGATAVFNATTLAPTTTDTTATLASGVSTQVTTEVGAISTLVVNVAFGSGTSTSPSGHNIAYSVSGGTAYVDVAYADAYGNLIPTGNAPATEVQVGLSATNGGLLSATNVYIAGGAVSTNQTNTNGQYISFGPIQLTMPSTIGTSVVVTATGVVSGVSVSGSATLTVVSASPTINITSPVPVSGYLYANTTEVTFGGIANATAGNQTTYISTIGYQVNSGTWESVATPNLHNVTWSIPIVLTTGSNSIIFNVTDSNSITTVGPTYTVLVDTTAPVISNITNVGGSSTVGFSITQAEGDLNASAVQVWYNGTALPASDISVTGTNNPGTSVTYAGTASGIPLGTWSVEVEATSLAGTSATASGTITVTSISQNITNAITFPAAASYYQLGPYPTVSVPVSNTQAAPLTVVVFAVVHNGAGQTLEVATSTVANIAPGASSTAYVPINLPAGTYSVNVFVWSTSGASLSQEQAGVSITYTV